MACAVWQVPVEQNPVITGHPLSVKITLAVENQGEFLPSGIGTWQGVCYRFPYYPPWQVSWRRAVGRNTRVLPGVVCRHGWQPTPREKWNDREVGSSGPKGAADCRFALTGLRQRRYCKAVEDGPEDGKSSFQPSVSAVWH